MARKHSGYIPHQRVARILTLLLHGRQPNSDGDLIKPDMNEGRQAHHEPKQPSNVPTKPAEKVNQRLPGSESKPIRLLRYFAAPAVLLLSSILVPASPPWMEQQAGGQLSGASYVWICVSVFGLVLTEQLYRRSPGNRRWALKPLIIGMAGMFAFDLLIYSGAVLFHQIDPAMWSARSIVSVIVIVFIGIATARNTSWTVDVYVSRDVVYQSTALLMAGVYLLVVASAAYWVHFFAATGAAHSVWHWCLRRCSVSLR
ncbi:MAG: hypothetical protein IPP88_25030 [Betaproteobacteria bacterium]|nr:hypothetical protein [Betaproteobacteria bacterium]